MASQAVADNLDSAGDFRKAKALQEARAAGTAAPEIDAATGKMINPHNPQFITQAPWYLNQSKASLIHQQAWNAKSVGTNDWYRRGTKGDVKTKFPKGACQNCGATTHIQKDCVERPRKVGAKHNGKNLMPDEYIDAPSLDYEGKRDRWNGFQPDDYKEVIEEWETVENERRKVKAAEMEERAKLKERLKLQKKALKKKRKQRRRQLRRQAEGRASDSEDSDTGNDSDTDTDTDSDSDASDDEDLGEKMKDFDKTTATVATKDDKLRTTTRNLRIREDTAKYLMNLDVNSAFYDPKSRSMRDDPLQHLKDEEKGSFRGDNFVRHAGDAKALTELTLFAWDAYKHGEKIHDFAQPTQALKMFNVYKDRSKNLKEAQATELVEKYGGQEHMNAPAELIYAQNDNYVEYARDGRIIKGRERALQKSKYEEDVLIGNHSSPWGTWYCNATGKWGYACCRQSMKNAYCVAQKSGQAVDEAIGDKPAGEGHQAGERAAATRGATGKEIEVADEPSAAIELDVSAAAAAAQAAAAAAAAAQAAAESSSSSSSASGSDSEGSGDEKAKKKDKEDKKKAKALKGLKLAGDGVEAAASSSAPPPGLDPRAAAVAASKLNDRRSSAFGHDLEDQTVFNEAKVAEAVEREKKKRKQDKKEGAKKFTLEDERKRGYNSLADDGMGELTPEEFEAYRLTKARSDDPMAKFV